jgi:CHAT domain-containing protein
MGGKPKTIPEFIPKQKQYLGDLFRLRILPSCQILNYCHQRPSLNEQTTMGIVENATGDLPYTTYECETIATQYLVEPSQRLQQSRATKSEYRQIASKVPILHSSHHGSANPENPLESALILSDGNLSLGELLTPGWRKDLQNLNDVYLNNCETNFSINKITDDLLSIATGFLCAGARSVVSTLWSVDDCASALLAIFYYEFRHDGSSRPRALQQAQQKLRNLTGTQLQTEYLEQLKSNLTEQYEQAIDQAEATQDSEEADKYRQLAAKIRRQIEHTLPRHCQSDYPFASPFYWAGFISQGLV